MARRKDANDANKRFPHAREDVAQAETFSDTPQTRSHTYRLAFDDQDFMLRQELRPVRFQLELLKAEMILSEEEVDSTIVMFGGARIPDPAHKERARTQTLADLSRFYDEARTFARLCTEKSMKDSGGREGVIVTGGGPGVMEAGNRGAHDAGGRSVSLNIVLEFEQEPNPYCTPELAFNFHYFAIRKMHFLMRAKAITVFPGGFGTLDELFESLTLIQTKRMDKLPVILFGREFWEKIIDWEALADAGTISPGDLDLFEYAESAEEALAILDRWEADHGE
ncbi:LOG family protein [Paracoccaceae bacterium GXU_MW_L88]